MVGINTSAIYLMRFFLLCAATAAFFFISCSRLSAASTVVAVRVAVFLSPPAEADPDKEDNDGDLELDVNVDVADVIDWPGPRAWLDVDEAGFAVVEELEDVLSACLLLPLPPLRTDCDLTVEACDAGAEAFDVTTLTGSGLNRAPMPVGSAVDDEDDLEDDEEVFAGCCWLSVDDLDCFDGSLEVLADLLCSFSASPARPMAEPVVTEFDEVICNTKRE